MDSWGYFTPINGVIWAPYLYLVFFWTHFLEVNSFVSKLTDCTPNWFSRNPFGQGALFAHFPQLRHGSSVSLGAGNKTVCVRDTLLETNISPTWGSRKIIDSKVPFCYGDSCWSQKEGTKWHRITWMSMNEWMSGCTQSIHQPPSQVPLSCQSWKVWWGGMNFHQMYYIVLQSISYK